MPNAVTLPAGTTLGKSYEYGVDVNVGTTASPSWLPVRRLFGYTLTPTPQTHDSQTYDDKGSPSQEVSGWAWALAFSTQVNRSATTGTYLPEIEALRLRTMPTAVGEAAQIEVRWYHKPESGVANPTDAGQGIATVAFTRSNSGPDGSVEVWAWTLTGVGSYEAIANPFAGWASTTPTLSSALPSAAVAGSLVTIVGTGFTGATAVKFGSTAATNYVVVSSTTIIATVPTGSAGSAPVTVTTPGGTSAALAYTRGA